MMKPVDYKETFMTSRDLPYGSPPARPAGACQNQGTLHRGRVVSLEKKLIPGPPISRFSLPQ